jgi:secondary thiamine-phosphate synthase enzyme
MQQSFHRISVRTRGAGLYDVTAALRDFVAGSAIRDGLLTVFLRHTSASLTVQENADPDVLRDLDDFFRNLVREDTSLYRHTMEGADDMPAHIRAALTLTQLSIPVSGGRMCLGTWQAVYVFEHRRGAFARELQLHLLGEP